MKTVLFALAASALAVAGCAQTQYSLDPQMTESYRQQKEFDSQAVESLQDAAARAAVIEQHALFPYHFAPGSAALTELGQRDLAVLTESYKSTPGPLALIKSDTPDDLYARRKDGIAAALQQAGLTGVTITDGPVGGRGITGNEAVLSRKKKDTYSSGQNTDTGSITDVGSIAPTGSGEMK